MGVCLSAGANLSCSFGSNPSVLNVLQAQTLSGSKPMACAADGEANVNVMPFGMCSSLANPAVASATAAALGVLTPKPCTPMVKAWVPSLPTILVGGKPAITTEAKLNCAYSGIISVVVPAQTDVITG